MPSEVILPRVDMDMTTGKISKWLVESGAAVAKGQPLFEIETDKAAMEIEAPASGTIRDLAGASDAAIPVGSVVAWIYKDGEPWQAGEAQPHETATRDVPASENAITLSSPLAPLAPDRPRATPMARRLAHERGLDLTAISGTGPRGRIQAQDVLATSKTAEHPTPPATGRRSEHREAEPVEGAVAPSALVGAGTSTRLIQLREGQGRPIVLLHGFGSDAGSWRPFLSGRTTRQPVYALDLPGHGSSPVGATSFDNLVDAVEAALAESAFEGFDIIAHSLGSAVSAAIAARGTLAVRSLLLLAPAGLGPEINGAFIRGYVGAQSEASLTPWMRELVADASLITPALVRSTLQVKDKAGGHRQIADALFPDGTQAFSIRADLARLTMPVRVVLGLADRIIPVSHGKDLPGLVAMHRFANVGHMPQLEVRDAILAIHAQMTASGDL